jgi:flagellar assembly protein FliH
MSPDPAVLPTRKVIRAASAADVATLAFPTIADAPKPPSRPAVEPGLASAACAVDAAPVLDPIVLEEARLEAAARGYEDGFAAGRDEAVAAVHAEADALLQRLAAAVEMCEARQQRSFDALTDDVARFAFATVEAILGRELTLASEPTRDAIARALRLAPDRLDATIVVHPDDLALLGPIDDLAGARTVELAADGTIERGGCIVRVADCEVDAQLGSALERLRHVLQVTDEIAP